MKLREASVKNLSRKTGKTLSGLFAEFDTLNQNGRIYPRKIYERALEGIMPKIASGSLLGEMDHPQDRDEICLSNVSHVITECKVQGNKVYGSVQLLDTPTGKIAQALVEAGIPIGISSRGVGNTRRIAEGTEVTDLNLITFDLVADPSFSDAVLTESAKIKLKSSLNSIERSLPLNEAAGENESVRNMIGDIREKLDSVPDVTVSLIESIGELTEKSENYKVKLSEALKRNKALKSNMDKLQEDYNKLVLTQNKTRKTLSKITESHSKEVASIKESHSKEVASIKESCETELIALRKELAIEKRGLSSQSVMPLLEGLTTTVEIEEKLDSIRHLGTRRTAISSDISSLTEGINANADRKGSRLSKLVSSV